MQTPGNHPFDVFLSEVKIGLFEDNKAGGVNDSQVRNIVIMPLKNKNIFFHCSIFLPFPWDP